MTSQPNLPYSRAIVTIEVVVEALSASPIWQTMTLGEQQAAISETLTMMTVYEVGGIC